MTQKPAGPLSAEVLAALQGGKLIEAIKLLRAQSGVGLKQAKEMVDSHHAAEPHRQATRVDPTQPPLYHEGLSPGEVPRSEDFGRTLVIVVIAAVAAYLLFFR